MAQDWKSILASVAPTVATMLGGPLAGMAVSAIGDKLLGKKTATVAEVETAVLAASPADLLKFKEIEADVTKALADAGVKLAAVDAADRDSARERESKVQDWTPRILAGIVLLGYFFAQWYAFHSHVDDASLRELRARIFGTLDSAVMCVLYYYFGSSSSSRQKDATISKIAESP